MRLKDIEDISPFGVRINFFDSWSSLELFDDYRSVRLYFGVLRLGFLDRLSYGTYEIDGDAKSGIMQRVLFISSPEPPESVNLNVSSAILEGMKRVPYFANDIHFFFLY